jgi:GNAT superfamily N-acetyltransferase
MILESRYGEFLISTDKSKLQFDVIHQFLSTCYWSPNIPLDKVKHAAENSLTFGIYKDEAQVGYSRVITDKTTFAYLADVFILEKYRGKGLSKWMVFFIMEHPELQGLRRFMLATRDAHGLYEQYGFEPLVNVPYFMQILKPNLYVEENLSVS